MSVFFSYILLGLSLAIPIGPVNAAQLDKGMKNGFFHSWFVGLGAVTADGIYMLAVYLGMVHIVDTPFIKTFLWLFGAFVLIYTGIESMASSSKLKANDKRQAEPLHKSFITGFLMSISNPLTILFWLGIYGSVLAKTVATNSTNQLILYSIAIFIGLLTWDLFMATASSGFRRVLKGNTLTFLSRLSGISLIGFGIYFGYEGFKLLLG
ncbi:threonine/homoserine/homoserine lactone efflux protein [Salirhabdus euzebyi]|uniref:Threonine/homoserine/homoserine lactone efflux protein n=1 Tax=Salirhabdus euzebyi TaxID=394506 RepID=A0A841Q848_9BACI|nr:LysE family transporter [Salirhabdus euzebyi]MBB6454494.1 threonine/homoserine/homoserine lactone efflux protein [Salirhabdus euzebyi]